VVEFFPFFMVYLATLSASEAVGGMKSKLDLINGNIAAFSVPELRKPRIPSVRKAGGCGARFEPRTALIPAEAA
jgi:hypothetical protein